MYHCITINGKNTKQRCPISNFRPYILLFDFYYLSILCWSYILQFVSHISQFFMPTSSHIFFSYLVHQPHHLFHSPMISSVTWFLMDSIFTGMNNAIPDGCYLVSLLCVTSLFHDTIPWSWTCSFAPIISFLVLPLLFSYFVGRYTLFIWNSSISLDSQNFILDSTTLWLELIDLLSPYLVFVLAESSPSCVKPP